MGLPASNFDNYKDNYNRVLIWWSAGITSAVAAKITLDMYRNSPVDVEIIYCDTGSEHPDNMRFLKDCERWYGHPIKILKSKKYSDIFDVFKKTRYLVGPAGARCTTELKKLVRKEYEKPTDLQVFGFDNSEDKRIQRFVANNFDVRLFLPLVQARVTKEECLEIVKDAGIKLPQMYKEGFRNNNCIGCVKASSIPYWGMIREKFPEVFKKMAKIEEELGISIIRVMKNGKKQKLFLKDLGPVDKKVKPLLPDLSCGMFC